MIPAFFSSARMISLECHESPAVQGVLCKNWYISYLLQNGLDFYLCIYFISHLEATESQVFFSVKF